MGIDEYDFSAYGLNVTDEQVASLKEISHAVSALNTHISFDDFVIALSQAQKETIQAAKMLSEMCAALEAWDKALPWYTRFWLRLSIRFDHYQMLFWDWVYGWEY